MIERIAAALGVDSPELFSMRAIPAESLKTLHKSVLEEINKTVGLSILGLMKTFDEDQF